MKVRSRQATAFRSWRLWGPEDYPHYPRLRVLASKDERVGWEVAMIEQLITIRDLPNLDEMAHAR